MNAITATAVDPTPAAASAAPERGAPADHPRWERPALLGLLVVPVALWAADVLIEDLWDGSGQQAAGETQGAPAQQFSVR